MTTVCCVCRKTKIGNNWKFQLIPTGRIVSHGYCPACYRQFIIKLGSFMLRQCA